MSDSSQSSSLSDNERRLRSLELEPPLPTSIRITLLAGGWVMILFGIVGLFLPVLQGILFLIIGGALLSLVSDTMLLGLRWIFRPWPNGWRRLLRLRARIHGWLTPGEQDDDQVAEETD